MLQPVTITRKSERGESGKDRGFARCWLGQLSVMQVFTAVPPPAWAKHLPNNSIVCSRAGKSPGTLGMQNGDYDGDLVMVSDDSDLVALAVASESPGLFCHLSSCARNVLLLWSSNTLLWHSRGRGNGSVSSESSRGEHRERHP